MKHNIQDWKQPRYRRNRNDGANKVWFGAAIALVGIFLLLKKLGIFYYDWNTFWPIILIAAGILIGVKKRFQGHAWWIVSLIGIAHLIPEFTIGSTNSSNLMLPLALIIGGAVMALTTRKQKNCMDKLQVVTSNENTLNVDVTFAGRKEIVTSKEFKGGNISATFGGVEINMIQADSSTQPMTMNFKVSFGGVELIVPSHWELQNEIESTFGSVEDHRAMRTASANSEEKKILILKGNCSFGSIEIKSY